MTVAIDGPAGTGKSTVAQRVAQSANLLYLNSGNLYRAITWHVLQKGIDPEDTNAVANAAKALDLEIWSHGVTVNGCKLRRQLREESVDANVASISAASEVRDVVNGHLRRLSCGRDVIAEGRDMTTVVFPDADVKVYLDASLESRARRRFEDLGHSVALAEVRERIAERDQIDTTKVHGRLKLDASALYIDSSHLTIHQVCEIVLNAIFSARTKPSTGAIGQS